MSTSQPEDPGPTADTAASAALPTAEPLDAECPQCGTRLRNVSAGADGRVHCLNCGQRFPLPGRAESGQTVPQAEQVPKALGEVPIGREPSVPSYAYLRIAGIVFLMLGMVLSVLLVSETNAVLSFRRGRDWHFHLWLFILSASPFLIGSWVFLCSLLAAPLDASLTGAAWRRGRMNSPLPTPPGGSLAYVLPTSTAGGLVGFATIFAATDGNNEVQVFVLGGGALAIATGLLLGFAFENLRLLLWRQAMLVERLSGKDVRLASALHDDLPWGLGGLCAAGATGGLVLTLLTIWGNAPLRGSESLIMLLSMALVAGFGWTVTLLVRGLEHVSGHWRQAAWRHRPHWNERPDQKEFLLRWGMLLPYFWMAIGILFVLFLLAEVRGMDGSGFMAGLGLVTFFFFLAILLSKVLGYLHSIRRAQTEVLDQRPSVPKGILPSGLCGLLFLWALGHLCYGGIMIFIVLDQEFGRRARWSNSPDYSELCLIFLLLLTLVVGISYLAIWLALSFREVRHIQAIGAAARAGASPQDQIAPGA